MFEIGVISIVVLAVGYWVTLWLMGRHDDVLHGDFVHEEDVSGASAPADQPLPAGPAYPAKPPFPPKARLGQGIRCRASRRDQARTGQTASCTGAAAGADTLGA